MHGNKRKRQLTYRTCRSQVITSFGKQSMKIIPGTVMLPVILFSKSSILLCQVGRP